MGSSLLCPVGPQGQSCHCYLLFTLPRDEGMWLGDRSKSLIARLLPVPSCPLKSPHVPQESTHLVALAVLDVLHTYCASALEQYSAYKCLDLGLEVGAAQCWVQVGTGCAPALPCRMEQDQVWPAALSLIPGQEEPAGESKSTLPLIIQGLPSRYIWDLDILPCSPGY